MPARSQAQRAYIYATKGKKFAEAHHFDNPGPLPKKVKPKGKPKARQKGARRKGK